MRAFLAKVSNNDEKNFFFDGMLYNIVETGVKYGLSRNLEYIFPQKTTESLHFLIIGLGLETEKVILDFSHGLTATGNSIKFTIIEGNDDAIKIFRKKYAFLFDFVEIELIQVDTNYLYFEKTLSVFPDFNQISAIFICLENQIQNLKLACSLRNLLEDESPSIITFCEQPESLNNVLNTPTEKTLTLKERNIHIINTFEEAFNYILELDKNIEKFARTTHNKWNRSNINKVSYENLSEHYKQSNRNQILDIYYKIYLTKKIQLKEFRANNNILRFTEEEKNLLAKMEHRRWMIEKLANGWKYDACRNDRLKKHSDIVPWEQLSDEAKRKDFNVIEIMIEIINPSLNES